MNSYWFPCCLHPFLSTSDTQLIQNESSGLPLWLVQNDKLPGPQSSPGKDGMYTKGNEDPWTWTIQLPSYSDYPESSDQINRPIYGYFQEFCEVWWVRWLYCCPIVTLCAAAEDKFITLTVRYSVFSHC